MLSLLEAHGWDRSLPTCEARHCLVHEMSVTRESAQHTHKHTHTHTQPRSMSLLLTPQTHCTGRLPP